jgi:Cu+-exporting ATPase
MIAAGVLVTATVVTVLVAARSTGRHDPMFHPATAVLTVEGLTCELCVRRLENRMALVPGVRGATADFARQAAGLTFQEGATLSRDDLTAAVRDAGFRLTSLEWGKDLGAFPILAQLVVHGKQAPACAEDLKRRLQRESGVRSVVVDVEKDAMTVVHDPQRITATDLMKALRDGQGACNTNQGAQSG